MGCNLAVNIACSSLVRHKRSNIRTSPIWKMPAYLHVTAATLRLVLAAILEDLMDCLGIFFVEQDIARGYPQVYAVFRCTVSNFDLQAACQPSMRTPS